MTAFKTTTRTALIGSITFLSLCLAAPASAASLIAYPAKGQTPEQQNQDQQQCHQWAVQQTGVDPATISAPAAVAPSQDRKVLRGAAAGAAVGGLGGSLGGEFGKGAAAGAAVGAVVGGIRKRREQKNVEEMNRQAQARQQQLVEEYNRAYGACLEGKGYTIK